MLGGRPTLSGRNSELSHIKLPVTYAPNGDKLADTVENRCEHLRTNA